MKTPNEIRRELNLRTSIERVWKAISTPEGLSHWFSDQVEADESGRELRFNWEGHGTVKARVEVVQPPQQFAFRWGAHGYQSGDPFTDENSTLVTFFLNETPEGTQLTLSETGFAELAPEHRQDSFEDNSGGWSKEMSDLQAYLSELEGK
ncbi:MAG: SRPBCC family protein [Anaerolineales bacterium]